MYGYEISVREYRRRSKKKIDNPEKLAIYGTQDEEKQNKNTTQYMSDTTIHKQRKQDMSPPTNNWRQR